MPALWKDASLARIGELEQELAKAHALREEMTALHRRLFDLETDRAARLDEIMTLQQQLTASELDRAARLDAIHAIEAKWVESEQDRAVRLERLVALGDEVVALKAALSEASRSLPARLARWLVPRTVADAPATERSAPAAPLRDEAPESAVFRFMSTDRALWRCVRRGLTVGTVIDVGASNGMWSAVCERHLPQSRYLLVEAQAVHRAALQSYCAARSRAEFVLAAAGARCGEIWFDDGDPFGGLASDRPSANARTKVPVTTLDHEVATRRLPGPYLVKLDTHGFEVPILDGAIETLRNASLVILECYCFQVSDASLRFDEMVRFMRERGFGVIDASEPLWRARDVCLWQIDLFFVPLSRPEFAANTWS